MKLSKLGLSLIGLATTLATVSKAQLIAPNCFLQGAFVEVGVAPNGAFGAGPVPATYHPRSALGGGGTNIAVVYDYGRDGWAVGTPGFFGDFIFPGTPFEGWSVQIAGSRSDAFYSSGPTSFAGPGGLSGSNTAYSYTPSTATCGMPPDPAYVSGVWTGSMTASGGGLRIRQTTSVDTNGTWVLVNTVFTNAGATPIPDLYYHRTCDPDNDVTYSSSFSTINSVTYQDDIIHRVLVGSYGFSLHSNAYLALGTKDCRAKCLIYQSWPPPAGPANNLDLIYAGTAAIGTTYYLPGQTSVNQDIAIGLVYRLGTLAPGDSTMISYAYIMKDSLTIDSVFKEPTLVVNCVAAPPSGPAPAPTYDTFNSCEHPGVSTVPVYIKYGGEKNWSWSRWSWSPATGLATTNGLTNTINIAALSGPVTYTITGTDSAFGMNTCANRVFYLTVFPCFNATSNSPDTAPICAGDTLRLFANGDSLGATYRWHGPGLTGPLRGTDQYINIPNATMADTGWFYVIRTIGTGSDTARTHVMIKPRPVIVASYNPPVCSGNLLALYSNPDSVGQTWTWRGPDGFTSVLSDPTRPSAPTTFSGVYTVVTTFRGCTDSATVNVVIDSTPAVPSISSNTPVCDNDTLFLTSSSATLGVTYSWTGPSGYTSGVQNPVRPNPPLTASGTYTVTATLGLCSSSATTLVEIRPTPAPVLGSNSPICSGSTLNLTASGTSGSTFAWTGPNGFTSTAQNPSISPAITANSGVYSVVVTLNGCISAVTTINVVVDSTPTILVLETNSPGLPGPSICEGDTLTFTALANPTGVTYTWTGPNSFASTVQNPVILGATPLATGTYTLVVAVGTCSLSAVINASVTPTPSVTATSNSPICSGDTVQLNVISIAGATFSWAGPYTFFSGASSPFRTPALTEHSGVYTVNVTASGCTNLATVNVLVNQTPTPPWIKWLTYCQFDDASNLQAFGSNVLWYTGSAPGLTGTPVPPKPNTNIVGYSFYYVNQTVAGCPSVIDSIRVVVNPKPTVTVSEGATVCPRESLVMTATNPDAIAYYRWYPDLYLSDTSGPVVTTRPETNMEYMVVSTNMYGCTDTATVNVVVKAAAVIHLEDSVTLYPGESYQINPQTNCMTFSWTPAGGLDNRLISNPTATPGISTKYIVTGITEWGCRTRDSISINLADDAVLTVPNAFAPGSTNTKFKIIKRGLATLNYFRIYDRWGVMVYESKDIEDGWDGTFKGVPQPLGVYIYDLSATTRNGTIFKKAGNLTLLR
jgi:gliding motility-associated-like protein